MSTHEQNPQQKTKAELHDQIAGHLDEINAMTAAFCRIEAHVFVLNGEEIDDLPRPAITAVGLIEEEVNKILGALK